MKPHLSQNADECTNIFKGHHPAGDSSDKVNVIIGCLNSIDECIKFAKEYLENCDDIYLKTIIRFTFEAGYEKGKEDVKVCHTDASKGIHLICNKCSSLGYEAGVQAERKRIQKRLEEYRDKGFEIETAVYSATIPDIREFLSALEE